METLGEESPSYSTVKSLGGGYRVLRMMDGLATLKMPLLMKYQGRAHTGSVGYKARPVKHS